MVVHLVEPVTVWLVGDKPARMVWQGRRWVVNDMPTTLREEVDSPMFTHPYERSVGFRFQARSDDEVRVFDVRRDGERWMLTAVYD